MTYTVSKGDSFWKIAAQHQVGMTELIKANPQIKNPSQLSVGQKITIPTISGDIRTMEGEVVKLVNAERKKAGLPPLAENWELSRIARTKSQDFINRNYFAHNSPTYGTPFQMLASFGIKYQSAAENIAKGQKTPAAVMQGWMNSAGHRANILNRTFNQIGVGVAKDSKSTPYWTQLFIKA